MQASPSTHFVKLAQAILFRGAGIDLVWRHLVPIGAIGTILFAIAWMRFRRAIAQP
jgi:ABC-2 type transport system permease protein